MVDTINLGTLCFRGKYFEAILCMQDDEGNVIPCSPEMQDKKLLALHHSAIENILRAHEQDSQLQIPEFVNDDGVHFAEGFRPHASAEIQGQWDLRFAAYSDRIRFNKLTKENLTKDRQKIIENMGRNDWLTSRQKLVFRYENGVQHNYQDLRARHLRIIQLRRLLRTA